MRITWTVLATEYTNVPGQDSDVLSVSWQCTCLHVASGQSASLEGATLLPPPDVATRVPFAKLTKRQVLGWCFALNVDRASIEAQLDAQVRLIVQPPVQRGLPPWKGPDANDIIT